MTNKEIISSLKKAYDVDSSLNKTRFIRTIKKPDISLLSFIRNQFKLISNKIYISCLVYSVVLLILLMSSTKTNQYILLAAGVPFFSLIIIGIVNVSQIYHMEEIEMATLFSLKMVILARMIIMTFITILIILIMTICTSKLNQKSFVEIINYFFIPYFLNMYFNLKIIKNNRNDGLKYCFVVSSLMCLLILFLIENKSLVLLINQNVYSLLLLILMILTIKEAKEYIDRLEDRVWNL